MEKEKFVNEIQNLLHENGAVKELQTKIRSELIQVLLNKKHLQPCKEVTESEKSINLLIIEYLMQKGLWYTASIMVSEAEFIEPPPEIETVITNSVGTVRRHNPSKLSHISIATILRTLDNAHLCAKLSDVEMEYQNGRNKSLLGICLKKSHIEDESRSVPKLEKLQKRSLTQKLVCSWVLAQIEFKQ